MSRNVYDVTVTTKSVTDGTKPDDNY